MEAKFHHFLTKPTTNDYTRSQGRLEATNSVGILHGAMPISCPIVFRPVTKKEFTRLDYSVMRLAFDSQNYLGRLCDEVVYRNDLAARILDGGLSHATKEVPLRVTHRDFEKTYRLDLVIGDVSIYELKTARALVAEHQTQLLNYLLLAGVKYGKLINFRPSRVETTFVNNSLLGDQRKRLEVDTKRWHDLEESHAVLRQMMLELIDDWGAFLETALYTEALVHFFGGKEKVEQRVPLTRDGIRLGHQPMRLLSAETAFSLTALVDSTEMYEPHLRCLLRLSPLKTMQWINLAHHRIEFITLEK